MSQTSTDPVADMLSRIRNAILVGQNEIFVPHSKVKESVASLLQQSGFIVEAKVTQASIGKTLHVTINHPRENARIVEIERVSKPGRRHYASAQKIPVIKRGRGIVIVSTSRGMMTGDEAKKQGIGGEIICKVY